MQLASTPLLLAGRSKTTGTLCRIGVVTITGRNTEICCLTLINKNLVPDADFLAWNWLILHSLFFRVLNMDYGVNGVGNRTVLHHSQNKCRHDVRLSYVANGEILIEKYEKCLTVVTGSAMFRHSVGPVKLRRIYI